MRIERTGAPALDYLPCRYGNSRLLFRGPRREFDQPYVLFLGGSTTYGKFVPHPFPDLVERATQSDCVNFGCMNAGIDSFVNDADVVQRAGSAELTVLELLGAQNLSNRFYRVHVRRNDRFLCASPLMQSIFPEVDFTEFSFNKHMLGHLQSVAPRRFENVRDELRQAWLGRMRLLIGNIRSNVILLWLRGGGSRTALGAEPLFVTGELVDALRSVALDVIEVDLDTIGQPEDMEGMVFGEMEAPAAVQSPGPHSHGQVAAAVVNSLQQHS